MLNVIDITFDFEFGELNNRAMQVVVYYDQSKFEATPANPSVKLSQVKLPTQITLQFAGKTNKDTIVNSNGDILKDMYVKIVGLKLDNLKIPDWVLQKKLSYVTDAGNKITTAYIGFNGIMTFDIPETNVFALNRRLNKDE